MHYIIPSLRYIFAINIIIAFIIVQPTTHQKNIAAAIHAATFTKYFIPLGNYIFPVIIWKFASEDSKFINTNAKAAINFQLSIFMYTAMLTALGFLFGILFFDQLFFNEKGIEEIYSKTITFSYAEITLPLLIISAIALFLVVKFLIESVFVLIASSKAKEGSVYQYPLCIRFLN